MRDKMFMWKLASAAGQESWAILLYSSTPQTLKEFFQSDHLRVSIK